MLVAQAPMSAALVISLRPILLFLLFFVTGMGPIQETQLKNHPKNPAGHTDRLEK
jgi:hypothetical protein